MEQSLWEGRRGTIRAVNASGAQFLLADLDLASTMLDHAALSDDRAALERNRDHARTACEAVAAFLQKLTLEEHVQRRIEARLHELRRRLDDPTHRRG